MIKQSWNIASSEIIRILEMHEKATKNLYLMNEQATKTEKLPPKEFQLPKQSFASGYHSEASLSPEQKTQITNVLNQIATYIKDNKGVPMKIQIISGESSPANYDKENKKSLGKNELATLRGKTMKRILTNYFQGLVDKGILTSMPQIPDAKTNIDLGMKQEPFRSGDDPGDEKFLKDQFIKFTLEATGEVTTECLVGLQIMFVYNHVEDGRYPCRGGHTCDEAVFDVYLNKTKIGTSNLNNDGCEGVQCNRRVKIDVTPEMVNSIVNSDDFKKRNQLQLWYSCVVDNCHSGIPEIYIFNKEKKQLFPNTNFPSPCVATGAKRGDKGPWSLMILDGCGNPLKMSVEQSKAEMQRIQDEMAADELEKQRKKKEEDDRVAAEQAALRKQYVEVAQTQGFNFVKNSSNTNMFSNTNFSILEQFEEGGFYTLKVKNIRKSPVTIGNIDDTVKGVVGKFAVPGGLEFTLRYPLLNMNFPIKKKRFEKEFDYLQKVGTEGTYYYLTRDLNYNGTVQKGTKGSVLKPNFQK
jgi:hypothetical protein